MNGITTEGLREISSVPNGKRGLPVEVVYNFRMDFPENYCFIRLSTEMLGRFGNQCFKSQGELGGSPRGQSTNEIALVHFSKKKT